MTQIQEDTFRALCTLNQKFRGLQKNIQEKDITPKKRVEMHQRLEALHDELDHARQQAVHIHASGAGFFSQLDEMEHEFVSLYREIDDRFEEYEVTLISREALHLGSSLEGKMVGVAKLVDSIQHNIHFLFKHRRPSMQHRKVVHLAMKIADIAKEALSPESIDLAKRGTLVNLLKTLLREAVLSLDDPVGLSDAELAMDLYEIAELFYVNKKREAMIRLGFIKGQLTSAQLARVESITDPDEMIQALLEIADGDPCLEFRRAPIAEAGTIIRLVQG